MEMLSPAGLLQSALIAIACTVLLVNAIPDLGSRFIDYGLRSTPPEGPSKDHNGKQRRSDDLQVGPLSAALDSVAALQVPHGSFAHFYAVSVLSSLFWGFQIVTRGNVLKTICHAQLDGSKSSMSMDQIALAWSLFTIQGLRRLLESYFVTKHSASTMWFVHWYLGVAFYSAMGVVIWIEGTDTLLTAKTAWGAITFSAPSLRTLLCIPVFLVASGIQYDCHAYLASLPKYTLPSTPIFSNIVCPHYTAECIIYASLAILAAPRGMWINRTLFCVLVFVVVNLGVTASTTKKWYGQKFGKEKVENRWKIIPGMY